MNPKKRHKWKREACKDCGLKRFYIANKITYYNPKSRTPQTKAGECKPEKKA